MGFISIAELFDELESLSSRNDITEKIVTFFGSLDKDEVQIFAYLLTGRVAPMFVDAEFNFAEKGILTVLKDFSSLYKLEFDSAQKRDQLGDIGLVAYALFESISEISPANLSVVSVYGTLWEIINSSGTGSNARRMDLLATLLQQVSPVEAKYICRIVTGKLRLGVSSGTLLDVYSFILAGDKSKRLELDELYGVDPDLGHLAHRVISGHFAKDTEREITLGIPIRARLVERVKSFEEVFERLEGQVIFQPKFDGLRCQVHKGVDMEKDSFKSRIWAKYLQVEDASVMDMFGGGESTIPNIKLFSRNLEDITDMFPAIVKAVEELDIVSVVFDCEVVGWNESAETFTTFQETMTRKRKRNISSAEDEIPARLYIFDIMHLNGTDLLDKDLTERLEELDSVNLGKGNLLHLADTQRFSNLEDVMDFFEGSVGLGLEGLVAKQLTGGYQPGKRNYEWIKLKKSMSKALVDSVDLVVMGYYFGSGKKAEFGIGALLGGIMGEDGSISTITKIGTGVTDDQWRAIISRLEGLVVQDMPKMYKITKELTPDVWVAPEVVCSVEADEITESKVHLAASSINGAGLALRFPRLIEFDRDKSLEDATSEKELLGMYKGGK